jgi:excisionase family DNA binding protein
MTIRRIRLIRVQFLLRYFSDDFRSARFTGRHYIEKGIKSMHETLLTAKEAAQFLQIAEATLYRKAKSGEIPTLRFGRELRFRKTTLNRWLEQKANGENGDRKKVKSSFLKFAGMFNDYANEMDEITKEAYENRRRFRTRRVA